MVIDSGLEGLEFTETSLSAINGAQGQLSFCGYMLTDLGEKASYEEVSFLVWSKRLPTAVELDKHSQWLTENRPLPKPVWGIMHVLPDKAEPMEALRTVASALSTFDRSENYLSNGHLALCQSVSLTAKLPTIVASFDRLRHSLPPIEPNQDLGHATNFLYMLAGREPDPMDARALETYLTGRPWDESQYLLRSGYHQRTGRHILCHRYRAGHAEGTAARRRHRGQHAAARGYRHARECGLVAG